MWKLLSLPLTFVQLSLSLDLLTVATACSDHPYHISNFGQLPHRDGHRDATTPQPVWYSDDGSRTTAAELARKREQLEGFARWNRERGQMPRSDDELRDLEWGDLNILHTTDIHGWYQGHRKVTPPEPNYSGDWADWASFAAKMRQKAHGEGRDLLLVDTGDLHDGNGLSDGFPPYGAGEPGGKDAIDGHVSNKVFSMVDYDLLTIGNHELYNYTVAKDVFDNFRPRWIDRYMTSNVKIAVPDADDPSRNHTEPIGSLAVSLVTPVQGIKVVSYGILFDFKLAAPGIIVQPPEEMIEEQWFNDSLDAAERFGVDIFVILGHMPVSGDPAWQAVRRKIRSRFPDTPISILGGHTHVRDCRMLDDNTMAMESGRYLETIGFMGVQNLRARIRGLVEKVRFTRRYIDPNPRNFAHHLGLSTPSKLLTQKGRFIRFLMDAISDAWNLTRLHGVVPQDYYLDRLPYGHNHSLLTLLASEVLPKVVRPSEASRRDRPSLVLINSGSQRFDVFRGPFTRNDQYIVSPFKDDFLYMPDVPWRVARRLLGGLTDKKPPSVVEVAQGELERSGEERKRYGSGFIEDIFIRWQKSQWAGFLSSGDPNTSTSPGASTSTSTGESGDEDQGAPGGTDAVQKAKKMLEAEAVRYETLELGGRAQGPSLGYRTIDGCEGEGDDTIPDYVASNPVPEPRSDEDLVDVVFVDFIMPPLLELMNSFDDSNRTYTADQVKVWGDITTQLLYPRYAELEWQPPQGAAAAVREQRADAAAKGYAPFTDDAPSADQEPEADAAAAAAQFVVQRAEGL
ncbi:uncharacterized protein PSFLO_04452 [Pseudozyma flocculosa]|uniref:Uncharacterized protein n=1 Tax=Pseudozyma flocculosa TaxID=84751 RepID=A0A5C3F389_9BASI|nr:uncharacterized protein PSFLO_04452 [Pseudozyma flocculosa]